MGWHLETVPLEVIRLRCSSGAGPWMRFVLLWRGGSTGDVRDLPATCALEGSSDCRAGRSSSVTLEFKVPPGPWENNVLSSTACSDCYGSQSRWRSHTWEALAWKTKASLHVIVDTAFDDSSPIHLCSLLACLYSKKVVASLYWALTVHQRCCEHPATPK